MVVGFVMEVVVVDVPLESVSVIPGDTVKSVLPV